MVACMVNGNRTGETFKTREEAETRAEQIRIAKKNELLRVTNLLALGACEIGNSLLPMQKKLGAGVGIEPTHRSFADSPI